jgi:hypothetical protein
MTKFESDTFSRIPWSQRLSLARARDRVIPGLLDFWFASQKSNMKTNKKLVVWLKLGRRFLLFLFYRITWMLKLQPQPDTKLCLVKDLLRQNMNMPATLGLPVTD